MMVCIISQQVINFGMFLFMQMVLNKLVLVGLFIKTNGFGSLIMGNLISHMPLSVTGLVLLLEHLEVVEQLSLVKMSILHIRIKF